MKPILFNTEMVQAILEGRKTITRRLVKPQPLLFNGRHYIFDDETCPKKWEDCDDFVGTYQYQPGDILYIRETWQKYRVKRPTKAIPDDFRDVRYLYLADGEIANSDGTPFKWRPSIHMPKEAARVFLRVTAVRVERLQKITPEDCEREGAAVINNPFIREDAATYRAYCQQQMAALWDSTIKPKELPAYGWAANPFVWVIEFEECEKPEEG